MSMTRNPSGEHALHLYEEESTLATQVASFLEPAFAQEQAVIAIATRQHLAAVEQRMRTIGHDVDALRGMGRYVSVDAEQLLPRLLKDGLPSAQAFQHLVAARVGDLSARYGGVRAFGELVQLLWREGKPAAALRLEDLWNELLGYHPLSLICGYRVRTIGGTEGPLVDEIVRRHWHARD